MGLLDWLTGNAKPDPSKPRSSPDTLIEALLALNDDQRVWRIDDMRAAAPGELGEALERLGLTHRPDLVATWKTDDGRVRKLLADAGVSAGFKVLLRLDEPNAMVRSVDHDSGAAVSSTGLSASLGAFRGQAMMSSGSATYKRDADGHWAATAENALSTNEIKQPIRQCVSNAGWGWHGVAVGRF